MKILFEFVTINSQKVAKIHVPLESAGRWINAITNYGSKARTRSVRIIKLYQHNDLWLDIYFYAPHQTYIDILNYYKRLTISSKYINNNSILFERYIAEVKSRHVLRYELRMDEPTDYSDMSVKSDFINLGNFINFLISREATILKASFDCTKQERYDEDEYRSPCSSWSSKGYPYIFIWFTDWRRNQLNKIRTYKEYKEHYSKYVIKIAKKTSMTRRAVDEYLNSIESDSNLTASQKIELINGRTITLFGEEMDCQDYLEVKHELAKLQPNTGQYNPESNKELFYTEF